MSERDKDYYSLLGVPPDATPSQIIAAYEAALKAAEGAGLELSRKAVEHAFAILGDPAARAAYDATRASGEDVEARYSEDDTGDASLPRTEVNHPRDPKGYYKLLRVPVDASQQEIFAAYFNHHIVKGGDLAGVNTRSLDAVSVAYNVLGDPILRAAYDPSWREPRSSRYGPATIHMQSEGRRFTEEELRLHDPAPVRLRRVTNSPFGCLSALVFFFGLVLYFI
jgi:curved DNA-binding protein CbpA